MLTPVVVRYQYALTAAVAVASSAGGLALWRAGGLARSGALLLVALQGLLGFREMVDALLHRYRVP